MSEFFKAELKDKFLQYAWDREDYFEVQLLYDEFLRPHYNLEYVQRLIEEIINYNSNLLDIMSGNGASIFMLSATAQTLEFLEEGGFKQLFVQEEEKWDVFLDQLSNTRKLTPRQRASLGQTKKEVYKREKRLLFGLITAVTISFIFTVFSLIKLVFTQTEGERLREIEGKLKSLEAENKELRDEMDSIEYLYNKNSE